ncbi:cell division protein FtsQ/DivIB [Desulfovibrio fairfieldensis]|uniref:Cell division protein FtsW n=1 Tax=Desulfovibrio fairfieldensis TaxID=44742 RepID=A0A0X8JJV9_9BACT|nr:FtsQ-type POTRA domain-containing protein [Desulfovibrio fairfieldensis]AMD89937.1 cell division protein FtsW [Desulfovibrio fairfieldensis]GKG92748.1 cell division protein FtsQ [Desulfovibrionaceae bacterium]GKI11299.1 cell division protein FtsQ [Desulfovibrionaceae bacterium]
MPLALKKNGRKARNAYTKEKPSKAKGSLFPSVRLPKFLAGMFGWLKRLGGLKSLAVLTGLLLAAMLVLAGVGTASLWLYNKAVTSDFFITRHVDVTGNVRLSREMVLQYGGIKEGDNSLAVSIAKVERNLRQTPWVEEVSVKRLLPDRFVIKLKERMPSFWVHKDGVLYYANERGGIIAPVESKNFLSLPTLRIEPGAEDAAPYLSRLMKDMQSGALPIEAGAIASVTVSPGRGLEIYLEDREMRLSIATDDWSGNLARMSVTLGDLARRHELKNVREVRAVNGNVWVILNQSAQN